MSQYIMSEILQIVVLELEKADGTVTESTSIVDVSDALYRHLNEELEGKEIELILFGLLIQLEPLPTQNQAILFWGQMVGNLL